MNLTQVQRIDVSTLLLTHNNMLPIGISAKLDITFKLLVISQKCFNAWQTSKFTFFVHTSNIFNLTFKLRVTRSSVATAWSRLKNLSKRSISQLILLWVCHNRISNNNHFKRCNPTTTSPYSRTILLLNKLLLALKTTILSINLSTLTTSTLSLVTWLV